MYTQALEMKVVLKSWWMFGYGYYLCAAKFKNKT